MFGVKSTSVLLIGGALLACLSMQAQQQKPMASEHHTYIDLAVTYNAERGKIASVDCGCFWMHGGSMNAGFTFYHGLGVAANLTGEHAADIRQGVDLDKVMFSMGPRYTYGAERWKGGFLKERGFSFFGEGLIGGVHGFNSVFPSSQGAQKAASSFAVQAGGGLDLRVSKTFGVRAFEADYVRTTLPNNADNVQHDFRVGAGVSWHFIR